MKHTYHIKMRVALWAALGMVGFALAPSVAFGGWVGETMCACPGLAKPLGNNATCEDACYGTQSSPGGSTSTPSYDYEAERIERERQAEIKRQKEAALIRERERLAEEKRKKDAEFIRNRDAAANTLKGSSGGALNQLKGLSGSTDSSGLKGSGFDQGSQLKGLHGSDPVVDNRNEPAGLGGKTDFKGAFAKPAPHTDTSVVDARNVPSGLPKALDRAIATAYSSAPPGVSDRVRKGFQAVMERDWKVAKAWFEDALNRDPNNAGLKRMIVLAEYSLLDRTPVTSRVTGSAPAVNKSVPDKAEIDEFFRNFRAGRKFTPTDKVRNHVSNMSNEEFKNRIWESPLQLPQDSDIDYLFDLK